MSYLKYKGYLGTIEPDLETGELFGKLAFIRDLITYEAETLKTLEQAFQESVDGYLESCAELGKCFCKRCDSREINAFRCLIY